MLVRLFRDLYQHKDGKVIRHRAGTVVDLPRDVADYVNRSVIEQRERVRAIAKHYSTTPEGRRK